MNWRRVLLSVIGLCVASLMIVNGCVVVMPQPTAESTPEPIPTVTPAPAPTPVTPEPIPVPQPEPGQVSPAPAPTPVESDCPPLEKICTLEGIANHTTVLEWPDEASIGDYVTVKIRVPDDQFWDCYCQRMTEIGEKCSSSDLVDLVQQHYSLYLMPMDGLIPCVVIGISEPDDNYEVWWHGRIPLEAEDEYLKPGVWKMIVEIGDPLGSVDSIVERNIVLK